MTSTRPVEQDTESKVNDELAVGSNLDFQRKWWRFEGILWLIIAVIVFAALLGAFGRGVLATAKREAPDGSIKVEYDRIARYSTPSVLTVEFGRGVVRENQVQLWLDSGVVKDMGMQRVVPQPVSSLLTEGGVLLTFSAGSLPARVQIMLEPTKPGLQKLAMRAPESEEVRLDVAVMP